MNEQRPTKPRSFYSARPSRRDVLRGISMATLVSPIFGCGGEDDGAAAGATGELEEPLSCVLYPEATEGPFYVEAPELNRGDLVQGETIPQIVSAVPLSLVMKFNAVDGSQCAPLAGARIAVWQCDAVGVYSGLESNFIQMLDTSDSKYLRGYQDTDASGTVRFRTIYPGWYGSRTIHIHFKVRVPSAQGGMIYEFNSQMYFDDETSDEVLARAPYLPGRVVRNSNDQVFLGTGPGAAADPAPPPVGTPAPGDGALLTLVRTATGYTGSVNVGLNLAAATAA